MSRPPSCEANDARPPRSQSSDVLAHHPASLRRQSGPPFPSCCLPLGAGCSYRRPAQSPGRRQASPDHGIRAFGPNVLIIPKGSSGEIPRLCRVHHPFGARESPQWPRYRIVHALHDRQPFSFHSRGSLSPLLSPGTNPLAFLRISVALFFNLRSQSQWASPIDGTSVAWQVHESQNSWASRQSTETRLSQR